MSWSEHLSPSLRLVAAAAGLALLITGCGRGEPVAGTEATATISGTRVDDDAGAAPEAADRDESPAPDAGPTADRPVLTEAELLALSEEVFDRLMPLGAAMSGGPDTARGVVWIDFEGDLDAAEEALGDLADHPAVEVTVPDCAVWDPADAPAAAIDLPGEGSLCGGMLAAIGGILVGDPTTGCLTIDSDIAHGDHTPTTILWPAGWTITPDGTIHDQHGQPRVAIGDRVEAGGGHLGADSDAVPETCRTGPGDGGVSIHTIRKVD
ncbi:hypothetical protein [Nitriliruptor alkaliphilus]|uniref:hypothetical protein n=1 Tax=Nitriliruptor alkaliphilus TaxID=427918 RepID=UPI000696A322|nr:hypothetical protein [Nitriliruptor alkaliphilus]